MKKRSIRLFSGIVLGMSAILLGSCGVSSSKSTITNVETKSVSSEEDETDTKEIEEEEESEEESSEDTDSEETEDTTDDSSSDDVEDTTDDTTTNDDTSSTTDDTTDDTTTSDDTSGTTDDTTDDTTTSDDTSSTTDDTTDDTTTSDDTSGTTDDTTDDTTTSDDTRSDDSGSSTSDDSGSSTTTATATAMDDGFMSTEDGYFTLVDNVYTISAGGTYSITGKFDGQIYIAVTMANTAGLYDVTLELNGVTLTNGTSDNIIVNDSVIYIAETTDADGNEVDYEVEISAQSGTVNTITDNRALQSDDEDTTGTAVIYSEIDLTLKGKGTLTVTGSYNNGIHTKDDLKIKNLTLTVTAPNNALKGNDSITIKSGTITVISTGGDGLKTTNTGLSSKGNQKGTITIEAGTTTIYSCCDAIDAAYDVVITGGVVDIYTSNYSEYSSEVVSTSDTLYVRVSSSSGGWGGSSSSSSYNYSLYFYNSDSDYYWVDLTSGTSSGNYTYYEVDMPSGYSNVKVYRYSSSQSTQSTSTYNACSSGSTINTAYDMLCVSYKNSALSTSWSTYSTSTTSGGQGSMGPGGESSGNTEKSTYSAKGIKSANEITISGGEITISAYDDGLHTNMDEIIESTSDYGTGNIYITGGTITITSKDDGIHAENTVQIDAGTITIVSSYEGIEGNQIIFNDGTINVYATDDAVNAADCGVSTTPCVYINGGTIILDVASGDTDTLDSNGNVVMTGGVIVIMNRQTSTSSQTGGTIDVDGSVTISGGTLISIGTWCSECSLSVNVSSSSTLSSGDYTLQDSSGNTIVSFTLSQSYYGYRIASKDSGTYTLYNGSSTITSYTIS